MSVCKAMCGVNVKGFYLLLYSVAIRTCLLSLEWYERIIKIVCNLLVRRVIVLMLCSAETWIDSVVSTCLLDWF